MGLAGKIWFATFDFDSDIAKGIQDGTIQFAIDQQPYLQGYIPVAVLAIVKKDHTTDPAKIRQILEANPKFQARLATYGLAPAYGPRNIGSGPGFITKANSTRSSSTPGSIANAFAGSAAYGRHRSGRYAQQVGRGRPQLARPHHACDRHVLRASRAHARRIRSSSTATAIPPGASRRASMGVANPFHPHPRKQPPSGTADGVDVDVQRYARGAPMNACAGNRGSGTC